MRRRWWQSVDHLEQRLDKCPPLVPLVSQLGHDRVEPTPGLLDHLLTAGGRLSPLFLQPRHGRLMLGSRFFLPLPCSLYARPRGFDPRSQYLDIGPRGFRTRRGALDAGGSLGDDLRQFLPVHKGDCATPERA